jgi:hypothetical protein
MSGATIAINDAAADDTLLSVKQRVFVANRTLFVRRQRLVYSAGPRGMDALADDETLGGAGVAQDGSAELDVLLADLTDDDHEELGEEVRYGCDAKPLSRGGAFVSAIKFACAQLQVELISFCLMPVRWQFKLIFPSF